MLKVNRFIKFHFFLVLYNLAIEEDLNNEEAFICFNISFHLSALFEFKKKKKKKN